MKKITWLFLIKKKVWGSLLKNILIYIISPLVLVSFIVYFLFFSKNFLNIETKSIIQQCYTYFTSGFYILYILNYFLILFFKKREKSIMFLTSVLSLFILFILMAIVTVITHESIKITFNNIYSDSLPTLHILKRNPLYNMLLISVLPFSSIIFIFKDEMDKKNMNKRADLELRLDQLSQEYYKHLFKGNWDINRTIESNHYKTIDFLSMFNIGKDIIKEKNIKQVKSKNYINENFIIHFADYEICGFLKNIDHIGGDFYDIWLDKKKVRNNLKYVLNISLFDIVGHGISSSTHLIDIIRFLQNRKDHYINKDCVKIAKSFYEYFDKLMWKFNKSLYICSTYCQIHKKNGQISLVNCKNIDPLYLNSNDKCIYISKNRKGSIPCKNINETFITENICKNIFNEKFYLIEFCLSKGDILIIGTDGLIANFCSYFSINKNTARLYEYISKHDSTSELMYSIIQFINNIYKNRNWDDDIACIIIKKIK